MNRRAFLKLAMLGAVGAALPELPLPLLQPRVPLFVGRSAACGPYLHAIIPQRKLMARIRITAEAMEASRHEPPGSFLRFARAEHQRCLDEFAQECARRAIPLGG